MERTIVYRPPYVKYLFKIRKINFEKSIIFCGGGKWTCGRRNCKFITNCNFSTENFQLEILTESADF